MKLLSIVNPLRPFVTDPEKNTIWDQTYEEAIEQSDTPQSIYSTHGNENDPNRLNVTTMFGDDSDLDLTPPVDGILQCPVVKEQTAADGMEFTTAITNVLIFNVNNVANKDVMDDDMELTTVMGDLKVKLCLTALICRLICMCKINVAFVLYMILMLRGTKSSLTVRLQSTMTWN